MKYENAYIKLLQLETIDNETPKKEEENWERKTEKKNKEQKTHTYIKQYIYVSAKTYKPIFEISKHTLQSVIHKTFSK